MQGLSQMRLALQSNWIIANAGPDAPRHSDLTPGTWTSAQTLHLEHTHKNFLSQQKFINNDHSDFQRSAIKRFKKQFTIP